jgi:hypothetical protein
VVGGPWLFRAPQIVWARQLDIESLGEKAVADGALLWVLGLKNERPGTVIHALNGAAVEVLGGLLYPGAGTRAPVPADQPAFLLDDSRASLSFAEEAFARAKNYALQLEAREGGKTTARLTACVPRGYGCAIPLLGAGR